MSTTGIKQSLIVKYSLLLKHNFHAPLLCHRHMMKSHDHVVSWHKVVICASYYTVAMVYMCNEDS